MSARITWTDDQVLRQVSDALKAGIDETTHSCVPVAQSLVRVRYGILRGSIQARAATYIPGRGWVGRWGSFDVNYALAQEVISFSHAGWQPYLRPAADREYPRLVPRIRGYLP
jgi:hypothetical protein